MELHKAFYGVKGLIHAEAEILHKVKTDGEIRGILGGYFNYGLKKDAYPLMSAVLRGNFDTQLAHVTADDKANRIPVETTLALSSETADFPKYRLTVTRDAPVNPDFETYNGVVPWRYRIWRHHPRAAPCSDRRWPRHHKRSVGSSTTDGRSAGVSRPRPPVRSHDGRRVHAEPAPSRARAPSHEASHAQHGRLTPR